MPTPTSSCADPGTTAPLARYAFWCGVAVALIYAVVIAVVHIDGRREAARGGTPLFTDFTTFYAAALQLRSEPAENLYVPERMYQAELAAARAASDVPLDEGQVRVIGYAPWMYPPLAILLAVPFGFLGYLAAYGAWLAGTLGVYLAAMQAVLRRRDAWVYALAAPPVFYNAMYGQTGFLTAGLVGLGLANVVRRPTLAGICIGLAAFKPHFGVLIPLALVAGGYWKPFGVATITVVVAIVTSIAAFGPDPWYAYIGSLGYHFGGFGAGAYEWRAMVTVLAALQSSGVSLELAWQLQTAVAVAVVLATVWSWRLAARDAQRLGLAAAVLCAGTLLAVPLAYSYDMVLIVPAAGWLWRDLRDRGGASGEYALLALAAVLALPIKPLAYGYGLHAGPWISLGIFGLALWRLYRPVQQVGGMPHAAGE